MIKPMLARDGEVDMISFPCIVQPKIDGVRAFNWKGQIHGAFKGEDFLDGECIEDVNNPQKLAENRRWELRDRPLRVREGDAAGFANLESYVIGDWSAATFVQAS